MKKILSLWIAIILLITVTSIWMKPINNDSEKIGWIAVKKLLKERFNCPIIALGREYSPLNLSKVKKFLKQDKTNEHEYRKYIWDCKHFALMLLYNISKEWDDPAVGILIYLKDNRFPAHAINFFIDESKFIYFIEPMTDNIFWKLSGKPMLVII